MLRTSRCHDCRTVPEIPPTLMDSAAHPFAVWEHCAYGRFLRTFPDSELASQFIINNGGELIANPCNW